MLQRSKNFHISTFEQIGFFDPFPKEHMCTNFYVPTDEDDEVYLRDSSTKFNPPLLHYTPSRKMMFKIMRACIDIDDKEDLWYH